MSRHISFGRCGEELASDFLRKNRYKILKNNYRTRMGEIDIIAEDKGTICFIEVKARHSDRRGSSKEAVSNRKQRQISKAALSFLKENKLWERSARFDVVSIDFAGDNPRIDLIKNAFDLAKMYSY